jgi:hypothetical protein
MAPKSRSTSVVVCGRCDKGLNSVRVCVRVCVCVCPDMAHRVVQHGAKVVCTEASVESHNNQAEGVRRTDGRTDRPTDCCVAFSLGQQEIRRVKL